MEAQGVISKVRQPTPWCAGMVVVIKKSGGVRICVDLKPLNKCVLCERHPLPRVDDTLAQLTGATTFSKLDTNSGFWQIPLSEESKLLTTFITPFGRYCYNKLPFGITSAPEHFQRRMSSLLEGLPSDTYIQQCPECLKSFTPPREPLITSSLPSHPWEKVASDLFHLNNSTYLIVVDYFSRYPEVVQLSSTTSRSVIKALQAIFSHHGVPSVFMSDNGPQYSSREIKEFANTDGFNLVTSSPHYAQSNGLAERTIQTVKALLQNSPDPYMALLSFRATPIPWCSFSPAELLMGRKLRTDIPIAKTLLTPQWSYLPEFRERDREYKAKQKQNYDQRHKA